MVPAAVAVMMAHWRRRGVVAAAVAVMMGHWRRRGAVAAAVAVMMAAAVPKTGVLL